VYSTGLQARGDFWFSNFSKQTLNSNIKKYVNFFNQELDRYKSDFTSDHLLRDFIRTDLKSFAWYGDNYKDIERGKYYEFKENSIRTLLYRPFHKTNIYYDQNLIHRIGKLQNIF